MIDLTAHTVDEITKHLDAVVEEAGEDHRSWARCYFTQVDGQRINETRQPGCLLGHLFASLGYGFEDLTQPNHRQSEFNSMGLLGLREWGVVAADDIVAKALNAAQRVQDSERSWGEAREMYRATLAGR